MGKKTNKGKGKSHAQSGNKQIHSTNKSGGEYDHLPFVSICTPTFNRRPFWPMAIKCFEDYTYPKERMEWIIVDDGSDPIEDLVKHIPQVKYYREEKQMILGRKRNYMHEKTKGDIIIYQDDDDYYPPERVSHAVEKLMADPNVIAGGSSILFLYFKHIQQMFRFGPYGKNHSTAGTFAFKRKLLSMSKYDDFKALAEEKDFLKDYTIPFVQFDPLKTILVFSHNHNTFDKKELLQQGKDGITPTQRPDNHVKVEDFVKSPEIYDFFMKDIDGILDKYEPGKVENKPEVLQQMKNITEVRKQEQARLEEMHYKAMQDNMVKEALNNIESEKKDIQHKMYLMTMVNKKLIEKMKKMNEVINNMQLDEDTLNTINQAETLEEPPSVEVRELKIQLKQSDYHTTYNSDFVGSLLDFINGNTRIVGTLRVNDKFDVKMELPEQVCQYEYMPHVSKISENDNIQNVINYHINARNGSLATKSNYSSNPAINNNVSSNIDISPDDIKTVMEQAECNEPTATKALFNENNDVISAIMNIDNYTCDSFEKPVNNANTANVEISQEDIKTVMEQAECNEPTATKALFNENNDVISAIMNIDNYTCDSFEKPVNNANTANVEISQEDIKTVMEQAECNEPTATKALFNENNDVISAIMNIDNYTCDSFTPSNNSNAGQPNNTQSMQISSVHLEKLLTTHPQYFDITRDSTGRVTAANIKSELFQGVIDSLGKLGIAIDAQQVMPFLFNFDLDEEKTVQHIYQEALKEYPQLAELAKASRQTNENNSTGIQVDPEDITTIMEQTNCTKHVAIKALISENNDAISAIMNIDKYNNSDLVDTGFIAADNIIHKTDDLTSENKILDSKDQSNEKNEDEDEDKAEGIILDGRKYNELTAPEQLIVDRIRLLSLYKEISIFHAKTAYYNENMDIHQAMKNYTKYLHLTPIDKPDHCNNIGQVLIQVNAPIEEIKKFLIVNNGNIAPSTTQLAAIYDNNDTQESNVAEDVCNQEYIDIVRSITLCNEETARNALTQTKGNVRECIIDNNISKYLITTDEPVSTESVDMLIGEEENEERA
uniref:Uncharacterized protein n=1 Tax=viral metagenome TaxID=1070528 RepID=A0A6C0FDP3_9ZZZZ